jgi:hypothetical protein
MDLKTAELLHFVQERENIRVLKEAGKPAPWTEDAILSRYRFCNIRRQDDRVSRWLLAHCYPHIDPDGDAWFVAAIMRLINWPPTLAFLLERGVIPDSVEDYDSLSFSAVLEEYKQTHPDKAYTGAFMLYGGGRLPQFKGMAKSDFIAHHLLKGLADKKAEVREAVKDNQVRRVVNAMRQSFGISSFMAGQVAADLTYLPWLEDAGDLYTYAPQGPGSVRGLARLKGLPLNHVFDQEEFNEELIQVNGLLKQYKLTLHDVQNVMCEVDKYWRTKNGEGKPRSIYVPETAY